MEFVHSGRRVSLSPACALSKSRSPQGMSPDGLGCQLDILSAAAAAGEALATIAAFASHKPSFG